MIKPKQKSQKIQKRINIDSSVLEEIELYCRYASFKKMDEFFEEAAIHILSKDKEFKDYKESAKRTDNVDSQAVQ
jgi:hypothetical protein